MAEKLSFYLSDEAISELDRLARGLGKLSGCPISRSAALTSLLENQAGVYLLVRQRMRLATLKYQPGGKFYQEESDEREQRYSSNDP